MSLDSGNALVYQIYPRSFQDSNQDGIGDIQGIISRLPYLEWLGIDAVWLSPIFASPQADMGYDVSDYSNIDPMFGSVNDVDMLIGAAHDRDIAVLFDIVPCHTSIEHAWFRDRPDFYVWHDGDAPPNNWISVFGGPAWTRDRLTGRWYLHNFYREQPQLNWRNPEVPKAIADSMQFWLRRGVDGFRIDAVQYLFVDEHLRDEPAAVAPKLSGTVHPDYGALDHVHTVDLREVVPAVKKLREALPEAYLVAEVYGEIPRLIPYTEAADLTFCFALLAVEPKADLLCDIIASSVGVEGLAWVMSNHDISRLATRWGAERARVAATLLLTLPGAAFIYQGDEIGMIDGPGTTPPVDRVGRDPFRHPMQWTPEGSFTTGTPWLPLVNSAHINVADQQGAPRSMLTLYRELIRLRRELDGHVTMLQSQAGVLSYRRGRHVVALNFGDSDGVGPEVSEVRVSTRDGVGPRSLPAYSGYVGAV